MVEISLGGKWGAGKVATVSDKDAEQAEYRWSLSGNGYVQCWKDGRLVKLHREVLGFGPGDPGIDHIDGDKLNNRRENLRPATQHQNVGNSRKQRTYAGKSTSSRYKGVSWHKKRGKWQVCIQTRHLGLFDSEIAAACHYDAAAREAFGKFARPNFLGAVSIDRRA